MINNDQSRAEFVKNTVAFLKKHKFDGLDLAWEYPGEELSEDRDCIIEIKNSTFVKSYWRWLEADRQG